MLLQQRGGLTGTIQRWWRLAPQFFALQADWLGHHESRGGEVMGCSLLLMRAVDVAGDEQGDLSDLLVKHNIICLLGPLSAFRSVRGNGEKKKSCDSFCLAMSNHTKV